MRTAKDCFKILRDIRDTSMATVGKDGLPYVIRQNNCLHCGRCYENCPVQAIIRK